MMTDNVKTIEQEPVRLDNAGVMRELAAAVLINAVADLASKLKVERINARHFLFTSASQQDLQYWCEHAGLHLDHVRKMAKRVYQVRREEGQEKASQMVSRLFGYNPRGSDATTRVYREDTGDLVGAFDSLQKACKAVGVKYQKVVWAFRSCNPVVFDGYRFLRGDDNG